MSDFRDGWLGSTSVVCPSSSPIVSWGQLMVFIRVRKFDVIRAASSWSVS